MCSRIKYWLLYKLNCQGCRMKCTTAQFLHNLSWGQQVKWSPNGFPSSQSPHQHKGRCQQVWYVYVHPQRSRINIFFSVYLDLFNITTKMNSIHLMFTVFMHVCMNCVCVGVWVCVRERVCVRVCVRARVCACESMSV